MQNPSEAAKKTLQTVFDMVQDGEPHLVDDWSTKGICLACGEEADGVEPDAEGYECEACGENAVCGFEQAILTMAISESISEETINEIETV